MRDASLPSVGSRQARFPDVVGTTKTLRLPAPHPRSLIGFARGYHVYLRLRARRSAPMWPEASHGPGPLVSRWSHVPAIVAWTDTGSPRFPDDPSRAFAQLQDPGRIDAPGQSRGIDAAPASKTAKAPAIRAISGLTTGLQHLLSTLQESPCGNPGKTRFRLAGSQPLPRGSRTRWTATKGFRSLTWPSSFPGLSLARLRQAQERGLLRVRSSAKLALMGAH